MTDFTHFSKIIAGTMTWGTGGKQFSKKEMASLIHHCLELGISTFDHADIYGGYSIEADFGKAFAESKTNRENVQLISKCGIQIVCESRENIVNHYNYSKEYIIWSVENSLKNLKTDYLDLLLLHRPSPLMDSEEVAKAVSTLKEQGKVLQVGVSNFTPSQMKLMETSIPVSANQVEFSLTSNSVMYDGTLDDCITNKRLAMSWSPLGSFFRENTQQTQRIQSELEPMTKKYKATEDQILLAWIMKHPSRIHPVVGTTTKHRLADACEAVDINLELEDWFILLEASLGHPVP